jgi:uncharacterized Zn-finger protein
MNTTTHGAGGKNMPNDQRHYKISAHDLPLHCPLDSMSLWNSHPRVYLPIEKTGQAKCPYCGTEFTLEE